MKKIWRWRPLRHQLLFVVFFLPIHPNSLGSAWPGQVWSGLTWPRLFQDRSVSVGFSPVQSGPLLMQVLPTGSAAALADTLCRLALLRKVFCQLFFFLLPLLRLFVCLSGFL